MTVTLVSDEKIAETSSKGNQEKWFDSISGSWYKLDQYGYEALAETMASVVLEKSNIETQTPFTFVRYQMAKLRVRGVERNGCMSQSFMQPGQSLITVNRLLSNHLGAPLTHKLINLSSDIKRIAYLADAVAEYTGLTAFPRYLALLFEVDALICNDDRHLNNIAVIESGGRYDYCPIFDNGAGLLSNTQVSRMDIAPKALVAALTAKPFNTTFNRQMNSVRRLYGRQLVMPKLGEAGIYAALQPLLPYYAERDRNIIADRVVECLLSRRKSFVFDASL